MSRAIRITGITADGDRRLSITPKSRKHVLERLARWEAEHGVDGLVIKGIQYNLGSPKAVSAILRLSGLQAR